MREWHLLLGGMVRIRYLMGGQVAVRCGLAGISDELVACSSNGSEISRSGFVPDFDGLLPCWRVNERGRKVETTALKLG